MQKVDNILSERTSRKEVLAYLKNFKELRSKSLGRFVGQGMAHRVYEYEKDFLLKVPKKGYIKKQDSSMSLKRDLHLAKKFFGSRVWSSRIITSPAGYVIIYKRYAQFRPVSIADIDDVRNQLIDIATQNRKLLKMHGVSLDFFGFGGAMNTLKYLITNRSKPRLDNLIILEDSKGQKKVYIEDFQLFKVRSDKAFSTQVYYFFIYQIPHYFSMYLLRKYFTLKAG